MGVRLRLRLHLRQTATLCLWDVAPNAKNVKVHSHYVFAFASVSAFASNCNIVSVRMLR